MTKKKTLLFVLVMLVAVVFAVAGLSSCQWEAPDDESETVSASETAFETESGTESETASESEVPVVRYMVTFKNGEEVVKTVEVKEGEAIAVADIPAEPESDFCFLGWYKEGVLFDSSAVIGADVTVEAKFSVVPKAFVGEWFGETVDGNYNAVPYKLVIGAEGVVTFEGAAEGVAAEDLTYNADYACIEFVIDGNDYSFGEGWVGYSLDCADLRLSVTLAQMPEGVVTADETGLVGVFKTENDVEIAITGAFVFVDGVQGFEFAQSSSGTEYNFYLDGVAESIVYDADAEVWNYVHGDVTEKIITPAKPPIVIPEAFRGEWSAADIETNTVLFVKITETEVTVYSYDYDSWDKAGKVASADDKSVVIKSAYETITLTANADGTINYNSGDGWFGVNIDLDKNAKAVFMYDYRVYYVAVLKDGKIDEDTFDLGDPEEKAYRFDGWFAPNGDEFDDMADIGGNAVYEGKKTKIANIVTFKADGADDKEVLVALADGVAKLTADDIPAAPAYDDGKVHLGWYNGAVEAKAGVEVKDGAVFTSFAVEEADYAGYWIYDVDKNETMIGIDVDAKKLSFQDKKNLDYKFENGHVIAQKTGYGYYTIDVALTPNDAIKCAYTYYDTSYEEEVVEDYVLAKAKAISGVAAGTYRLNKTDYFVIDEQGVITSVENGTVPQFGYISGTKSKLTIKYKTSSSGSAKVIENAMILSGNLLLGNYKNDPKIYVYGSAAQVGDYYCGTDGAHIYAHTVGDEIVYVYNIGDKYGKATITGEVGKGNVITVNYKFFNGEASAVESSAEYKFTTDTSMIAPGAEKDEYANADLGTLVLNGFGDATLTNGDVVTAYAYKKNGAGVVVLYADGVVVKGVNVADGAFTEVESDGNYVKLVPSGSSYYTLTIDGFGGATLVYTSYTVTETFGKYVFNADGNLVISDTNYSYNGTYVKYEDGKVFVNETKYTPVVLVAEGYTPASHLDEFAGYYVNGEDVVKITVADDTAVVLLNGEAAKSVKANWNGTILTYTGKDVDAAVEKYQKYDVTYTIKVVDGNIVISHDCIQSYDDTYEEFEYLAKSVTYTAADEPEVLDGLEGTYKNGSAVIVLDGKGNGTYKNGYRTGSFTYSGNGTTKSVSNFSAYDDDENEFTVTANGIKVNFSGDYGNYTDTAEYKKEVEEALDGLQGTYKNGSNVITLDGKGNGTYNNGTEYKFTYSGTGNTKNVSNFAAYDDDENTITVTDTGISVHFSGSYGDDVYNATFTKQ